jgi:hypothetical protein
LISPNVSLYTQLQSVVSKDDLLTVSAAIEWTESSTYSSSSQSSADNATQAPSPAKLVAPEPEAPSSSSSEDHRSSPVNESPEKEGLQRLELWVEDRLLNELLERFRWETEWIEEKIPMESPKLQAKFSPFHLRYYTRPKDKGGPLCFQIGTVILTAR